MTNALKWSKIWNHKTSLSQHLSVQMKKSKNLINFFDRDRLATRKWIIRDVEDEETCESTEL
jgi:hypothetical protein